MLHWIRRHPPAALMVVGVGTLAIGLAMLRVADCISFDQLFQMFPPAGRSALDQAAVFVGSIVPKELLILGAGVCFPSGVCLIVAGVWKVAANVAESRQS